MKKIGILILAVVLSSLPLFAGVSFINCDLNLNDEVLFTVKQDVAGTNPYKTLFYTKLTNGMPEKKPQVLTCYPEQMEILSGGNILQIRNRYGTARYVLDKDKLEWIQVYDKMPVNSVSVAPYMVSPDGKWFCKIERTSLCSGCLVLENVENGKKSILCENVLNTFYNIPAKWAPDSSVLVYEKRGILYFCNPEAVVSGIEIDEKYRRIGRGSINSISWGSERCLAYIDDYLLYKINTKELYTLGLYSGIIGQGKAMGRLPFKFNPKTDKFSANSDATECFVMQNNRLFSFLKVTSLSCDYMDVVYSRPYTDSSASLIDSYVFWDSYGNPVLWQEKLPYDGKFEKASVYRITDKVQQMLEIQDSGRPFTSPDGKKVAFYAGSTIMIYDINTWKRSAELSGEKIISALWISPDVLYVGGERSIRKWNLAKNTVDIVTLSSATAAYWDASNYSVIAETGSGYYYKYTFDTGLWEKTIPIIENLKQKNQNGKYRIFTSTTQNKKFENALYIRTLQGKSVTKPMFPETMEKTGENAKVAFVFDALDNSDGLSKILYSLKKYNAKGTFFINGEFIRRYPSETKQIAANGFECASMFFTPANLTENSFIIDEDFITRGLARNEDEFYDVTKKELVLFWHAPGYSVSPEIIKFAQNSGYEYVNPQYIFSDLDFTGKSVEKRITEIYTKLKQSGGGIVPVSVGYSGGEFNDSMYKYIELLLTALIDGGFEFSEISEF